MIIKTLSSSEWNATLKASIRAASPCVNALRGREEFGDGPRLPHAVRRTKYWPFEAGSFIVARREAGIRFPAWPVHVLTCALKAAASIDKLTAALTRVKVRDGAEGQRSGGGGGGGDDKKLCALTPLIYLRRMQLWRPAVNVASFLTHRSLRNRIFYDNDSRFPTAVATVSIPSVLLPTAGTHRTHTDMNLNLQGQFCYETCTSTFDMHKFCKTSLAACHCSGWF